MADKTYAFVENEMVSEIIPPFYNNEGQSVPIEERYAPMYMPHMYDVTDMNPMPQSGWSYVGGVFSPPVPPPVVTMQDQNEMVRAARMQEARNLMAPVLMALQLGDATDDESVEARAWQDYYRALRAVDTAPLEPVWPVRPDQQPIIPDPEPESEEPVEGRPDTEQDASPDKGVIKPAQ